MSLSPPDDFTSHEAEDSAAFETLCAHWGENREGYRGAVIPPIYQNSLFTFPNASAKSSAWGKPDVYEYTRVSNPTTDIAESKMAALERGEKARCFGSGMAAISGAILSCIQSGDHVVCVNSVYGPTRQFLSDYLKRFQVSVTFVDGRDPQAFVDAITPSTRLFMLESPSSVVFHQQDLSSVAQIARDHGIATICDNSWASPYFQNPLDFGIDLVLHSATKYLGGHSDIVAGVVVGSEKRIARLIEQEGCLLGAILDPFAAWLLIRGLRTLPIRMDRHQQNARTIACRLSEHPRVARVLYPGMRGEAQSDLTRRQLRGSSGLLTVMLKQNSRQAVFDFADRLRYFGIGCSWGGFESLVIPSAQSGSLFGLPDSETVWLVRLHIGLEHVEDIWADLEQALA